jgi:hypothetical protein
MPLIAKLVLIKSAVMLPVYGSFVPASRMPTVASSGTCCLTAAKPLKNFGLLHALVHRRVCRALHGLATQYMSSRQTDGYVSIPAATDPYIDMAALASLICWCLLYHNQSHASFTLDSEYSVKPFDCARRLRLYCHLLPRHRYRSRREVGFALSRHVSILSSCRHKSLSRRRRNMCCKFVSLRTNPLYCWMKFVASVHTYLLLPHPLLDRCSRLSI